MTLSNCNYLWIVNFPVGTLINSHRSAAEIRSCGIDSILRRALSICWTNRPSKERAFSLVLRRVSLLATIPVRGNSPQSATEFRPTNTAPWMVWIFPVAFHLSSPTTLGSRPRRVTVNSIPYSRLLRHSRCDCYQYREAYWLRLILMWHAKRKQNWYWKSEMIRKRIMNNLFVGKLFSFLKLSLIFLKFVYCFKSYKFFLSRVAKSITMKILLHI